MKFLEALRGLNNGANKFIDACKRARIQKNDRNALNEMEGCKKEAARALCEVLSAARGINTGEMAAVIDAIRNEMNNLMVQLLHFPLPPLGLFDSHVLLVLRPFPACFSTVGAGSLLWLCAWFSSSNASSSSSIWFGVKNSV